MHTMKVESLYSLAIESSSALLLKFSANKAVNATPNLRGVSRMASPFYALHSAPGSVRITATLNRQVIGVVIL